MKTAGETSADQVHSSTKDETSRVIRKCTASQREVAEQAGGFMKENIGRKVTLHELSRTFHVSETRLKNSFQARYGEPVYTWFKRRKMERAASLLREKEMSVQEIAADLGYENGSKFASAFRSVYGMTPGQYRRRARDGE